MTVSTTTSRWAYIGDGASTVYPYTNRVFDATDLKVYVDSVLQTLTTHYTVSGVGQAGGGNVTFLLAPAAAASVVIERQVPATQGMDLQSFGAFKAEIIETAFDRLCVLVQQLEAQRPRTLALAASDAAAAIGALPGADARKGKWLYFDGTTGEPTAATLQTTALVVSAFVQTLLDDADQAAACATLGAALLSVANVFTAAAQTLRLTDSGAAEGPALILDRNSASPAASDLLGALHFQGRDAALAAKVYGKLLARVLDPTGGSEDGELVLQTIVAGVLAERARLGQGLVVGSGTDPGGGQVNAQHGFQRAGVALPLQRAFVSAPQAYTNGGLLTIAHDLGTPPDLIIVWVRNVTSEHNWQPGDEVIVQPGVDWDTGSSVGLAIYRDSNNIYMRVGSQGLRVLNKTTGNANVTLTAANWLILVKAWA